MASNHILSIIVVTFNEAKRIARLKQSLDQLRLPAGIAVETILVDGGSSDGTAQAGREAGFTKVIEQPGASIPACRNRGVAESKGDWLAFVDGDCEAAPDWIEKAKPLLESAPTLILGWPARPPEPPTWVQKAWQVHWEHKNPQFERFLNATVVKQEGFRLVTTRNMILHRAAFESVGSFDERLPTGEDTDFVFRAYSAGIAVLGYPELKVVHHGEPATLGQFFRQQLWHANRTSFRQVLRRSGGRIGANAIVFTGAFALCLLIALIGICARAFWMATPLALLLLAPAVTIALRARQPGLALPLAILYAAYGAARVLDLAGIGRKKSSWKA